MNNSILDILNDIKEKEFALRDIYYEHVDDRTTTVKGGDAFNRDVYGLVTVQETLPRSLEDGPFDEVVGVTAAVGPAEKLRAQGVVYGVAYQSESVHGCQD